MVSSEEEGGEEERWGRRITSQRSYSKRPETEETKHSSKESRSASKPDKVIDSETEESLDKTPEDDEDTEAEKTDEKTTSSECSRRSKQQKSESSSDTIDFNFLTAKLPKGRKSPTGPRFLIQPNSTPPLSESETYGAVYQKEKEAHHQVKRETNQHGGKSVKMNVPQKPEVIVSVDSSSEEDYDSSEYDTASTEENESEIHKQQNIQRFDKKPKIVSIGKMGKIAVLEEIQERDEPRSTPVNTSLLDSVESAGKERIKGPQDIESSASKMWSKATGDSEEPRPHILSSFEESDERTATNNDEEDEKKEVSRQLSSPSLSELSTSLSVRINPHTEVVRGMSARGKKKRQQNSDGTKTPPGYPAGGEKGIVMLEIPESWQRHPWILELLKQPVDNKQDKMKSYRRLIKRGEGQISPRLKKRFALGGAFLPSDTSMVG